MKNKAGIIISSIFLFIFLCSGLLFILTPFVAEKYILPDLVEKLPFDEKELSLSRLTPWRLEGAVFFADKGRDSFSVAKVEARYSPASLLQGRVTSVSFDSAVLHVDKVESNLSLRGLRTKPPSTREAKRMELPVLPVIVEEIEFKDARMVVHEDGKAAHIIINGNVVPEYEQLPGSGSMLKALTASFSTQGAMELEGSIATEPDQDGHKVDFKLKMADLSQPLDHIDLLQNPQAGGRLNIQGHMRTEGMQAITDYDVQAELIDFSFQTGSMVLHNSAGDVPVSLRLQGDMEKADYQLRGLELHQPEQCTLLVDGQYDFGKAEVQGRISLLPARTQAAVNVGFQGTLGEKTMIHYQAKGEKFTLENGITAEPFSANGSVNIADGAVSAMLEATFPKITDPKHDLSLVGIAVELPFNSPPQAPGVVIPGNMRVEEIRYKEEHSGTLKGAISLAPDRMQLAAQLTTPFFENFRLTCSGEVMALDELGFQCSFPESDIESGRLPGYVSFPEDLEFSGKIGGEIRYTVAGGVQSGDAGITLKDLNISLNEYSLTGLSGSIKFPRLPYMTSSPSQLLAIDQIRLGKIFMSDARVALRVDDGEVVFIEKARLNWSGGLVEAGAVKLFKNMERVQTTLYCDRLQYTELLSQLGIGDAEGEGSLNGRLPVDFGREGIEFDNGFLFSTPGNSGIVRFKNTQKLRQGIAAMSQTVYLDYSMDALENFSYNWTKLTFNTEGEELLLTLQLDGKPAEPLPYGYKEGQIARSSEGKGIQHPIRLDVNFRLPMRELFRYGKNIQSFMENM